MLCVCNNNILVDEQALQETSQHWWTVTLITCSTEMIACKNACCCSLSRYRITSLSFYRGLLISSLEKALM